MLEPAAEMTLLGHEEQILTEETEYLPILQFEQTAPSQNWPLAQIVHTLEEDVEKEPAKHLVQELELIKEKNPGSQSEHMEDPSVL